jgi:hypothetical protein
LLSLAVEEIAQKSKKIGAFPKKSQKKRRQPEKDKEEYDVMMESFSGSANGHTFSEDCIR